MACKKNMERGEWIPQRPGCQIWNIGPQQTSSQAIVNYECREGCVATCSHGFVPTFDGKLSCGLAPGMLRADGKYRTDPAHTPNPVSDNDIPIVRLEPTPLQPISLSDDQTVTLYYTTSVTIQDDQPAMDALFSGNSGFFEFGTGSDVKEYRVCSLRETFAECASRDTSRYTCGPPDMGNLTCTAAKPGLTDGGGGKQ